MQYRTHSGSISENLSVTPWYQVFLPNRSLSFLISSLGCLKLITSRRRLTQVSAISIFADRCTSFGCLGLSRLSLRLDLSLAYLFCLRLDASTTVTPSIHVYTSTTAASTPRLRSHQVASPVPLSPVLPGALRATRLRQAGQWLAGWQPWQPAQGPCRGH